MRSFIGLNLSGKDKLSVDQWREKSLAALTRPQQREYSNKHLPKRATPSVVPAANLHITLCFLGDVSPKQHEQLTAGLASVTCPAFSLTLDTTGYWQSPKIVFTAPSVIPPALKQLAFDVTGVAHEAGIKTEKRDYQPHVTLFRKVPEDHPVALFMPDVTCDFTEFHLFESLSGRNGVTYPVRQSWPLIANLSTREKLQKGLLAR